MVDGSRCGGRRMVDNAIAAQSNHGRACTSPRRRLAFVLMPLSVSATGLSCSC